MKNNHVYGREPLEAIDVSTSTFAASVVTTYRIDINEGGLRERTHFPVTRASLIRCQRAQLALMDGNR